MINKTQFEKELEKEAMEEWSKRYIDEITEEGKTSYTIEDIHTAFLKGGEYMKDILQTEQWVWSKLMG